MQNGNHSKPQVLICGDIAWAWPDIDQLRSKFDFLVSLFVTRVAERD